MSQELAYLTETRLFLGDNAEAMNTVRYVDQRSAGLESGGHVRDFQDQTSHVNTATALRYAQASDAQMRQGKIRLPFA